MKIVNMLKSFAISLYESLKRFPIAIGLSSSAAILMMILVNNEQNFNSDTSELLGRIIMILALGIPVSLCTKLMFERKVSIGLFGKAGTYALEALALAFYYFNFLKDFEMVAVSRYVGISLSLYLAFLFIPYFLRRDGLELYVIRHLTRFFTAIIYSLVLYLGIAAILFTVDKLLGVKVDEMVYIDVWFGVAGIFAPSFFLAGVPLYEEQLDSSTYPKLLRVLVLYIVMPILSIYTAILYLYFAKIIITLQWPIGMVAHLVLWYSAICAGIIFLTSPLKSESKWVHYFSFWLPKVIIPLIIMMFVSVGIRIKAYGITENRYFVIALSLWVLGIMLYSNFSRVRRNIVMLISLSLVACLSVVGPWSSYSISVLSQNQRLEGLLQKYDMIKDNSVVKTDKAVSQSDKKEISEILMYFSDSHSFDEVKYLPKGFSMGQMKDVLGFNNTGGNYHSNAQVHFIYSSKREQYPIDIRGYSFMFLSNGPGQSAEGSNQDIKLKYDNKTHEVIIYSTGKEIYRSSLLDFGRQMYSKYGNTDRYDIGANDMTFTDENENVRVKFIVEYMDVYEDREADKIDVGSMTFYTLVELKQVK